MGEGVALGVRLGFISERPLVLVEGSAHERNADISRPKPSGSVDSFFHRSKGESYGPIQIVSRKGSVDLISDSRMQE